MTPGDAHGLTYERPGLTDPGEAGWAADAAGFRRFERTAVVGRGDAVWARAGEAVLQWGVKRRSGFRVAPAAAAAEGAEFLVTFGWGPLAVREPVRVVAVADLPDRRGFAYGTLPGHPVCGEEAFIVHRDDDGTVYLTLRSLTRPAPSGVWRIAFPVLLIAQRLFRRRYFRALRR